MDVGKLIHSPCHISSVYAPYRAQWSHGTKAQQFISYIAIILHRLLEHYLLQGDTRLCMIQVHDENQHLYHLLDYDIYPQPRFVSSSTRLQTRILTFIFNCCMLKLYLFSCTPGMVLWMTMLVPLSWSSLKYLNNYSMDCHDICFRYFMLPLGCIVITFVTL